MIKKQLNVLNIGSPLFKETLLAQDVDVTHLDWKPAAGGNAQLVEALDKSLNRPDIDRANKLAIEKLLSASPILSGMELAGDLIPNMTPTTILHAGPPIGWDRMAGPLRAAVLGALVYEGIAANIDDNFFNHTICLFWRLMSLKAE